MIIKGKQALLRKHVIKIIIAVLSLIVLVAVAFKLFGMLITDNELEKAEGALEVLIEKINALEDSKETKDAVIFMPPKNWFLKSYLVSEQGHPPGQCVGDVGCLCMHGKDTKFSCNELGEPIFQAIGGSYIICEDANLKGQVVCLGTDAKPIVGGPWEIKDGLKSYYIRNLVPLRFSSYELKLIKQDDKIIISFI